MQSHMTISGSSEAPARSKKLELLVHIASSCAFCHQYLQSMHDLSDVATCKHYICCVLWQRHTTQENSSRLEGHVNTILQLFSLPYALDLVVFHQQLVGGTFVA